MTFKQRFLLILIFMNTGLLLWSSVASAQVWHVYRQKEHCSISRQGWLTVSKEPPGYGWQLSEGSTSMPTFAAAAAQMDALKLAECQSDVPNCPKFRNDCCPFYVYLNTQTGTFSVLEEGATPGAEAFMQVEGPMCCEDAALEAGQPGMGCTMLDLTSVPGVRVVRTEDGWRSLAGPVTIPSNPPVIVFAPTGGDPLDPPPPVAQDDDGGWIDIEDDGWIAQGDEPDDEAVPPTSENPPTTTGAGNERELPPPPPGEVEMIPDDPPEVPTTGNQNWAGSWSRSDGVEAVTISGSGDSISASFQYEGSGFRGSGQWTSCRVSGNSASCSWTANHDDDTKSGSRKGMLEMSLNGDTITGRYIEDTPQWSWKPGYGPHNVVSVMFKGAVFNVTYTRK